MRQISSGTVTRSVPFNRAELRKLQGSTFPAGMRAVSKRKTLFPDDVLAFVKRIRGWSS